MADEFFVVGSDIKTTDDSGAEVRGLRELFSKVKKANFEDSYQNLISALSNAFENSEKGITGFETDTIDVNLGVTADGKVGLLGTGVETGFSASIKVTFKRRAVDGK